MRRPLGGLGMRKKIKHEIEDLDSRIRMLLWERYGDVLPKLEKIGNYIVNEFKEWTPLKLLSLSYFIGPYLRIINSLEERYGPTKVFYIDAFAGSGVNKVGNTLFAGSPLVAIDCTHQCKRKFDLMIFNDLKYGNVLKKRIEALIPLFPWLKNRFAVFSTDANKVLADIVERILV